MHRQLRELARRKSLFSALVVFVFANMSVGYSAAPAAPKLAPPLLGPTMASLARFDAGEILLAELNCVACHQAADAVKARLASRPSPVLGADGMTLTPQYLRAFLTSPHAEKPGSTMPDLLHGAEPSAKAETVEALVHYLVSLAPSSTAAPTGADQLKMQQGRLLYHQVGCVACHAPQEPASAFRAGAETDGAVSRSNDQAGLAALQADSVPLGNLAKKTTVEELAKFLMNPFQIRPSGRMPSLNLSDIEAAAISIYLLREQAPGMYDPAAPLQKIKGLSYQYYEGRFGGETVDFDAMRPRNSGVVDRFKIDARRRNNNFGFRFSGLLNIQSEGDYTFFTESDDGSRLYLGTTLVVKNDGQHAMAEAQGKIHLKPGEHPLTVTYFNGGAEFGLKVSYQGPGVSKREIPAEVLSHLGQPMIPIGSEQFTLDAAKAARGKEIFSSVGCAACHPMKNPAPAAVFKANPFDALKPDAPEGCLGDRVGAGRPQFQLSAAQRAALRATLANRAGLAQTLDPRAQVVRAMSALNCSACHSRAGVGGPDAARAEYFTTVGEVDLGDEGRLPPHLTGVGAKLRGDWLSEVLLRRGTVRPYMATRMPQFGKLNVEPLVAAFGSADDAGPTVAQAEQPAVDSIRLAKLGHKLVGREGLTCIACHTFAQFKSLGVPAMDLTQMAKRLKKDWFRRYLLDPASLRPGTRMPSFWPEGVAANQEILGGKTDQQIEAIWAFLSRGREADVPSGLIQPKMELVADKEAVIYRNFIEGAGARGIAVGYPEKANLAFDAANLRLAMIWQGPFIDASRHRSDRGAGFTGPLGNNIVKLPPGAPFAVLADSQAPWPETTGKKAGYQMRGYRLDEKRRPTFLYSVNDIQIEDYPVAATAGIDPTFNRTLTLHGGRDQEKFWFRAAVGSKIEAKAGGEYWVDGKLALRFELAGSAQPLIRQSGGQAELLVPVMFQNHEAKIVEKMIW